LSPLPQILSDRFGWPEMVQGFATRYNALPPDVRAHTGIFCHNYGEASAVNILGPAYGLPPAISGHQNYFYWGWNNYTGESMLVLGRTATTSPISTSKWWTWRVRQPMDHGLRASALLLAPSPQEHLRQDWPELKYWY